MTRRKVALFVTIIIVLLSISKTGFASQNSLPPTDWKEIQMLADQLIADNPKEAANELVEIYNNSKSSFERGHYAIAISKTYNELRNCDSILHWADLGLTHFNAQNDNIGIALGMFQQGYSFLCIDEHEKALERILEGIEIMENEGEEYGKAIGFLRMSRVFHFSRKLNELGEYGVRAGEIFDKENDVLNAVDAWSYGIVGLRMTGQKEKSYHAVQRILALGGQLKSGFYKALSLNSAASHFCQFDQYDSTYVYRQRALDEIEGSGSRFEMIVRNGKAMDYYYAKEYDKSIPLLKDFLDYVTNTNEVFFMAEMPRYISDSYAGLGQYDSAYHYMRLNWQFNDSLFVANQDKALQDLRTKYETEKKEASIVSLNKSVSSQRWLLILGGAFLLFSLFAIYYFRKLSGKLEVKNKENVILLKEIHHRVKNNLQILSSLLSLQSDHLKDSSAIDAILEGRNRVESMGLIHQRLYGDSDLSTVDMSDYGKELCRHLEDSFSSEKRRIRIVDDFRFEGMDVDYAIPLGLIINELVTNSIKYAFNDKGEGILNVSLYEADENLILNVRDNGDGNYLPDSSHQSTSFGSKLIKALNKKLKGSMTIDQSDGYSCTIKFLRYQKEKV